MSNVKAFRLYNFMAFRDSGWIELNAVSLLFGRNSSGKSVIIRALRLLKQSLDSGPGQTLVLSSEDGISLGAFNSILHNQGKIDRPKDIFDPAWIAAQVITFQFRCVLDSPTLEPLIDKINRLLLKHAMKAIPFSGTNRFIDFSLQFAYEHSSGISESTRIQLVGMHIDCEWNELAEVNINNIISVSRLPKYEDTNEIDTLLHGGKLDKSEEAHREKAELIRQGTLEWSSQWLWESDLELTQPTLQSEPSWEIVRVTTSLGFLPDFQYEAKPLEHEPSDLLLNDLNLFHSILLPVTTCVSEFLKSIQHLGPLRPEPQREYIFTSSLAERWRRQGLGAMVEFLEKAPTNEISHESSSGSSPDLLNSGDGHYLLEASIQANKETTAQQNSTEQTKNDVDRWLQLLELGKSYRIKRQRFFDSEGFVASLYIEDNTGRFDNISDVGSGVSQVFPIIIMCLNAPTNSLVIIEQPELHLHPKVQAILADLFIETQNRGVRFLLETHSEHLLVRTRLRVSQTSAHLIADYNKRLSISDYLLLVVWVYRIYNRSFTQLLHIDYVGSYQAIGEEFRDFFASDMDDIIELNKAARKARKLQEDRS